MWPFLGAALSAGSSVLGGILGRDTANKNLEMQQQTNQQNLAIAQQNRQDQLDMARANYEHQKEFAQSGIQWKVEDATKAGLHPLYALGGGATYSPVSMAGSTANISAPHLDDPMPNAISSAGQNIGRAIAATQTDDQRMATQLNLQRMKLENDLLATEIAGQSQRNAQTGPAFPSVTSTVVGDALNNGLVKSDPMKVTPTVAGLPGRDPGMNPDVGYARTPGGSFPVIPGTNIKNQIEDVTPYEWAHYLRNVILPQAMPWRRSPPFAAPAGQEWNYNWLDGYYLQPKGTGFLRKYVPPSWGGTRGE